MGSWFGIGNSSSSSSSSSGGSAEAARARLPLECPAEDWPWVWGIQNPRVLDWKTGLTDEEIGEVAKRQGVLPVRVSGVTTAHGEGKEVENGVARCLSFWLGDAACARDVERITAPPMGITHIINVAGPAGKHHDLDAAYAEHGVEVLRLDAEDEEGFPMLNLHLERAHSFVSEAAAARAGGSTNVLVHCTAGINRSGVLVAALVMLQERRAVLDVVRHIRSRRGNAYLWNHSFQRQLVALARREGLLGEPPTGYPQEIERARAQPRAVRALFD